MVVRATAAADNSVWAGGAGAVFKGYADVTAVLVEAGAAPDLGSPTARQAAESSSGRT